MRALRRPSLVIASVLFAGASVLALVACGSTAAPRRMPVSSTTPDDAASARPIIATRQAKVLDELRRVAESRAVVPRAGGPARP